MAQRSSSFPLNQTTGLCLLAASYVAIHTDLSSTDGTDTIVSSPSPSYHLPAFTSDSRAESHKADTKSGRTWRSALESVYNNDEKHHLTRRRTDRPGVWILGDPDLASLSQGIALHRLDLLALGTACTLLLHHPPEQSLPTCLNTTAPPTSTQQTPCASPSSPTKKSSRPCQMLLHHG